MNQSYALPAEIFLNASQGLFLPVAAMMFSYHENKLNIWQRYGTAVCVTNAC